MDKIQLNGHKRAAIYARVSTDDQRGNYSITTQVAGCLKHADARGYIVVGDRFVDPETGLDCAAGNGAIRAYVDDYTSREISRPSLDAALTFAERTGFDVLLVHALDRLARDPYIRQTLEREFSDRGARVEFVLGSYDESAEGEVRKDLDATFGKWENAKRVERSNRGKIGKAQRGQFVAGRAPYGYALDPDAPGGLRVVNDQAEVVKSIFELYVNQGYSIRGIKQHLSGSKALTSQGGAVWGKSTVARILANETYTGVNYYNKYKRNGKRLIERDRAEWVSISITPIIDRATFDAAQRKLSDNKAARRCEPKRFYLLSGMVFCAHCGRPYVAQAALAGRNKRKAERLSYRHRASEGGCCNHEISARNLESEVWHDIVEAINNPDQTRQGYADAKAAYDVLTQRQRDHIARLQANLEKVGGRKAKLDRMYSDPDFEMTKDDYLKQKAEIDAERRTLEAQIETAQVELAKVHAPVSLETFDSFMAEIRRALAEKVSPSPAKRRKALQILHVKVLVSRDEKPQVEGWYKPGGLTSTTQSCNGRQTVYFRLILSRDKSRVVFTTVEAGQ